MPDTHGPLRIDRFEVEIDGKHVEGFKSIDLPSPQRQPETYREGKDPMHSRTLVGPIDYPDMRVERGVRRDETPLYDWWKEAEESTVDEARKEMAVKLQNAQGEAMLRYEFTKAWVVKYDPPQLNSDGGGVATATYTITYDEMRKEQM